ncbi:MAG TPA: MFS transporter [Burkholderiaceae bacterium]|nr:MFS transporter [Burkholderiaceae bacterium]
MTGMMIARAPATAIDRSGFRPTYVWTVFALTFALMLSDFMTRNVMSGVMPLLARDWTLNDSQLGMLVSIVPLVVGIASWPISLLADRWGHVRSVTAMAVLWCVATIGCGLSQTHAQMFVARAVLGLGEAAYTSVGGAVLSRVFPAERMAAVLGAFQSAAVLGTVLGVAAGGVIAARYGWPAAFISLGLGSLGLVVLFALLVRERPGLSTGDAREATPRPNHTLSLGATLQQMFAKRSASLTYIGSGLQTVVLGALAAWLPTFLAREYGLPADQAGLRAALIMLGAAIGMVAGGSIADRAARARPRRRLQVTAAYAFISFVLLSSAFTLPPGGLQMALLLVGSMIAGGHVGIVSAVVIDLSHPGLRATALGTVVLFNNLLGLVPGPLLVGALSDAFSLATAMTVIPLAGAGAAACFLSAARGYEAELSARVDRGPVR